MQDGKRLHVGTPGGDSNPTHAFATTPRNSHDAGVKDFLSIFSSLFSRLLSHVIVPFYTPLFSLLCYALNL